MWWVKQAASLRELVGLILAGCHSELELWGYTDVFNVPGLDDAQRQRKVVIGGKTYWLDMAYEAELLNIELDGRAYHSSDEQRARDETRDIALAKLGWHTVRLSTSACTTTSQAAAATSSPSARRAAGSSAESWPRSRATRRETPCSGAKRGREGQR